MASPTSSGTFTMGIVDDDALALRSLREIVADRIPEGRILWTETSGQAAVEHCASDQFKPDIVLVDMTLGGLRGVDVCRQIRMRSDAIALLAMATFLMKGYREATVRAGVQGLIGKGDEDVIVRSIRIVAGGGVLDDDFDTVAKAHARVVNGGGIDYLTPRETEVITLLSSGLTDAEISNALNVDRATVRKHMQAVRRKLRVDTAIQAVVAWLRTRD